MIDIHKLKPEEVISQAYIDEYKRGMEFFHLELVHLNTNIYVIDRVLNFPFHTLVPHGRSIFFRLVFENFFYTSLLIITRMATDQSSDFFTLPQFRNKVRNSVKKEYKKHFDSLLREVRFDKKIKISLDKVHDLRSVRVAHSLEDFVFGETEEPLVKFGDLKDIRDHLISVFDALAFNVDHMMLPIQYSSRVERPKNENYFSDIEELLRLIAENSPAIRRPENQPLVWEAQRENLPKRELEAFNFYRSLLGLPKV